MTLKAKFITIEGGDGSGKTTQIKMLSDVLNARGIKHIITREPGGCSSAMDIREILLKGESDRWDGLSELFLYSTARNEHLRKVIRPTLEEGTWVICDRFADSTHVYQSIARGIPVDVVEYVTSLVVQNTQPDLTLVFDIDPAVGIARTQGDRVGADENRIESEGLEFHKKIRQGYLDLVKKYPERCQLVNAEQSIEEIHGDIMEIMNKLLQESAA